MEEDEERPAEEDRKTRLVKRAKHYPAGRSMSDEYSVTKRKPVTMTFGESLVHVSAALFAWPDSQYVSSVERQPDGNFHVLLRCRREGRGVCEATVLIYGHDLGVALPTEPNTIRAVLTHISSKFRTESIDLLHRAMRKNG